MITGDICRAGVNGCRLFRKNYVYKDTWVRMVEGRVSDRELIDNVLLSK